MENKKFNSPSTTVSRNLHDIAAPTGNVYESAVIISKRSNQISAKIKEELRSKLEEFATSTDSLEEVFENKEQIEVSKHYERLPKPTDIAIQEFLDGKIYFRKPDIDIATS